MSKILKVKNGNGHGHHVGTADLYPWGNVIDFEKNKFVCYHCHMAISHKITKDCHALR